VATNFGYPAYDVDGMPIVFSWPAIPSSIDATDIEVTLNTGEKVNPDVLSLNPNTELNERSTIVVFGSFGNRISPGSPGAQYVANVKIVGDMLFVGPGGVIKNARGLTYNASNSLPYGPNAVGPKLVAAKLNRMADVMDGEGTAGTAPNPYVYPNDCISIWGPDAKYRLRMFTSGGFSPDGVSGVFPTDFEKYFRLHATLPTGETLILNETGKNYPIGDAGSVKIIGLADLGKKQDTYNLCYQEDQDNQIDICLSGDEAAIRLITGIELPVGNKTADPTGKYKGMYNPGGPGNDPTPEVNYTQPFSYQLQGVKMALDVPMVTSYNSTAPVPAACTYSGEYKVESVACAGKFIAFSIDPKSNNACTNSTLMLRTASQSKGDRKIWTLNASAVSGTTPTASGQVASGRLGNCPSTKYINLAAGNSAPTPLLAGPGSKNVIIPVDAAKSCDTVWIQAAGNNPYQGKYLGYGSCSSQTAFKWEAATSSSATQWKLVKA